MYYQIRFPGKVALIFFVWTFMFLWLDWLICDFQDFDFLLKIFVDDIDGVPLTISYHLCFLHIPKIWSMLHHVSVGRIQNKECCFMFTHTFWRFFVIFQNICAFIIFISFFWWSIIFSNRILTSPKQELMIRSCQWNCMHHIQVFPPNISKCRQKTEHVIYQFEMLHVTVSIPPPFVNFSLSIIFIL